MKRLLLAFIGGVLIPTLYFCVVAFLAIAFKIYLPFLLRLPLLWSGTLYDYFYPDISDFKMFSEFRFEVILANFIGNFLFYTILTYVILWWREKKLA